MANVGGSRCSILGSQSIMDPTGDNPWSMEVTNAIPKDIMSFLDAGRTSSTNNSSLFVTGCSSGRWYCSVVLDLDEDEATARYMTPNHKSDKSHQKGARIKYILLVWYASPKQTLKDQKLKGSYAILHHDGELNCPPNSIDSSPPLVAMTAAENPYGQGTASSSLHRSDASAVFVYAANPITGALLLWKVSRSDLHQQMRRTDLVDGAKYDMSRSIITTTLRHHPFGYKCFLFSTSSDAKTDESDAIQQQSQKLTCLDVAWGRLPQMTATASTTLKGSPCIVVGSSCGQVYWITQTHVPTSLQVQSVSVSTATNANDGTGGGFLSLLFTPSKKKARWISENSGSNTDNDNIVSVRALEITTILPMDRISYYFLSTSVSGQMIVWKVTPTESSHLSEIEVDNVNNVTCQAITHFFAKYDLTTCYPRGISATPPSTASGLFVQDVTTTTSIPTLMKIDTTIERSPRETQIVLVSVIVAIPCRYHDDHDNGNQSSDSRLYWIQMKLGNLNQNSPIKNTSNFDIIHVEWLNRFVHPLATTSVIGFTISDDDIAYAAFGSKSNGSLSSITNRNQIVMTLPFTELRNQPQDFKKKHVIPDNDSPTLPPFFSSLRQLELVSQVMLPRMWSPDVITYGIVTLSETGLGLRIRYLPQLDNISKPSYITITDNKGVRQHFVQQTNEHRISSLMNHLHATHRESYVRPDDLIRLPPVILLEIGTHEIEEAVVGYARKAMVADISSYSSLHTQHNENVAGRWDIASLGDPMEWHVSYLTLLQQSGIYRTLSETCKWKLLGVGQEIEAFNALSSYSDETGGDSSKWSHQRLRDLRCDDVANWLIRLQIECVSQAGTSEDRQIVWLNWLCLAMEAAMTFREERAMTHYDVPPNQPPIVKSKEEDVPIWTSTDTVQTVLTNQLQHWYQDSKTNNKWRSVTRIEQIEMIVQFSLLCCCDSYVSKPDSDIVRQNYAVCRQISVDLIRKVKGVHDDQLAFELSQAHNYFDGLCRISYDHERRSDREHFSLIPLFQMYATVKDIGTGLYFPKHVLTWFMKRKLLGQVLHYGKQCPYVLDEMMNEHDILKPYRWITATRRGDLNDAVSSLLENASNPNATVADTKNAICTASLCNSVLEKHFKSTSSPVARHWNNVDSVIMSQRQLIIDKKRELINAQEQLLGQETSQSSTLLPTNELLEIAIDNARDTSDRQNGVRSCLIALAICTCFEDHDPSKYDAIVFVWYTAISIDQLMWEEWLNSVSDYDSNIQFHEMVLDTTVFGGLLQRCHESDGWERVGYSSEVEHAIFEKLASHDGKHQKSFLFSAKLRRLLRRVVVALHKDGQDDYGTDMHYVESMIEN